MTYHGFRHRLITCTTIALLATTPPAFAFSLSDLFGGDEKEAATEAISNNPLTSLLSSQLGISPEQAAGGAGALLSVAASQLSGDQAAELANMIPGAEGLTDQLPPGVGALLGNMDTINQIFSALGMDASMVTQFIPVVLQFLGDQGASAGLLDSLGSIWKTAQ